MSETIRVKSLEQCLEFRKLYPPAPVTSADVEVGYAGRRFTGSR